MVHIVNIFITSFLIAPIKITHLKPRCFTLEMPVSVVIDTRETIKEDALRLENSSVAALELGDYVFRDGGEDVLVVERKTLADFAASITDGRHREQKSRLLGVYPSSLVVYVIEGDIMNTTKALAYSRIGPDVLMSAMLNTMMRDGIHVIRTSGPKETVYVLGCIQKKLASGHSAKTSHTQDLVSASVKSCKQANVTPEVSLQMMLTCIPSVSITTASSLCERFSSMKALVDALVAVPAAEQIEFIKELRMSTKPGARRISKKAAENIVLFLGLR